MKRVVETYVNETDELTHVFVDGEEIIATPSHPFYCPTKGWTDASHLRAGDILVLVNGEYVVVEKVQHELLERPVKVYNFQVEDYHTYYVASACWCIISALRGKENYVQMCVLEAIQITIQDMHIYMMVPQILRL